MIQAYRVYMKAHPENAGNVAPDLAACLTDIAQRLRALQDRQPHVGDVRGKGLMIGLRLWHSATEFQKALYKAGVITNCTSGDVIRIVPPFVVTAQDIQDALRTMRSVLSQFPQTQELATAGSGKS